MNIYTIGFTKKTAKQFFEILKINSIDCVVDIRLHPDGQLSGFSKKSDLSYFLQNLISCEYKHMPNLAPADSILKAYRADKDWVKYEIAFESLMNERSIPHTLEKSIFKEKSCCLLCSEEKPHKCHRRLVAERLKKYWEDVEIIHL